MQARSNLATFAVALSLLVAACGGSSTPPAEQSKPSSTEAPADSPAPSEPEKAESKPVEGEKGEAKAETGKPTEGEATGGDSETAAREVTYTQTPEGMRVDVSGVRFTATAKPVKVGGGWGVDVQVEAKSTDGKAHKLLSPKNGPIAFGGKVDRKGESEELGDKRDGNDEKTIESDAPIKFSRTWPGTSGAKPLTKGQTLELHVGLWGVGDTTENRRPLKKFVSLKMVAGDKKPQPVLSPPEGIKHF